MNIPATNRLFLSIEWVFIFASICVQGCCILFQVLYVSGKSWSLTLCRPSLLCGDPICPHSFLSHSMQELFQTLSTISKLQFYHPFTFRRQTCFLVQRAGDGWWVGWGGVQDIKPNLSNFLTSNLPTYLYLDQICLLLQCWCPICFLDLISISPRVPVLDI